MLVKPPQPDEAFGQVLRKLRRKQNLSQETLAHEADLQRNFVSLLERSQNQPTITTLFKLCAALKIKPSEMMTLIEQECDPP